MAGHHPFLTKLRAVVKTLGDDALAGLANKGLLRRAQKDLETAKPALAGCEESKVRVQFPDAVVEVPELPAKSKCSCPATGICRHVLGALLFLRDDPELAAFDATQQQLFETGPEAPPPGEAPAVQRAADILANVTDEELRKWAGKALLTKAQKALAALTQVEIEAEEGLVVRFPSRNITCRWIPSGGLLGMTCSCQAETVCEHVVLALLAYQASLGKRTAQAEDVSLAASVGAPRTREEVLASVQAVLADMVGLGLARLSSATAQRLTTLAVSAHGVDLPRLERMLAALAREAELVVRRDARSSTPNLFYQACRIEALRAGLVQEARPRLVGLHRTSYHDVGQLTLVGMGARRWRSASGYHGVTVYFWDEAGKGWASWSEARPIGQAGFDPASRFRSDGPWLGCGSPVEASRSVVKLTGAYRNAHGRLSGRPSTRALVLGPTLRPDSDAKLPPAVTAWADLSPRARQVFGGGLADREENQDLVLLQPAQWGPAHYDTLRQELVRPVADSAGRVLELWLPYTAESEPAIDLLEKHDPQTTQGVVGALRLRAGRVCVEPISLLVGEELIPLNLPEPPKGGKQPAAAAPALAEATQEELPPLEEDDELPALEAGPATALARVLITAQAELEAAAESGLAARRDLDLLAALAKRLDALGLAACARPLAHFHSLLASGAGRNEATARTTAAALLRTYYILRLAADQESLASVLANLGAA